MTALLEEREDIYIDGLFAVHDALDADTDEEADVEEEPEELGDDLDEEELFEDEIASEEFEV